MKPVILMIPDNTKGLSVAYVYDSGNGIFFGIRNFSEDDISKVLLEPTMNNGKPFKEG